jgi:hypothetical protein
MVGTYYGDSTDLMLSGGSNFRCLLLPLSCPCFNLAPGPSYFYRHICKRSANPEATSPVPYLLLIHQRAWISVLRATLGVVEKVNVS